MFLIHGRILNRIRGSKTMKIAFSNKSLRSLKILEKGTKSSQSFTVTLCATCTWGKFFLLREEVYGFREFTSKLSSNWVTRFRSFTALHRKITLGSRKRLPVWPRMNTLFVKKEVGDAWEWVFSTSVYKHLALSGLFQYKVNKGEALCDGWK